MARHQAEWGASGIYRQLVEACKRKDLARIKSILAERPELANHRDKQNRSLLHYAVIMMFDEIQTNQQQSATKGPQMSRDELEQCIECFDFLTDRCDIKLWWNQDSDGLSVLHMAVISSNVPMVEHIIYEHPYALKYPLVCTKDREHHSPLHWAVITNNLDSVKLLVNYAGTKSVHEPDLNGATPLHYATQTSDYPRYRLQLRCMLKNVGASGHGDNGDPKNNDAPQDEQPPTSGLDPIRFSSAQDHSVGHQRRSLEILEYLVRLPQINLECSDKDHRTPLLWAASSGNRDAIELLLAHGARVASYDANRLGALHCAASHGFTDCIESIFCSACGSNTGQVVVDANQVDNLNCTPLFYGVLSGNVDCVETLLERGAHSDWQDSKGRTAAHFAALKGQLGALKLLQERGANLWLANKQGDLPLHYAIKSGRLQVVRWLLEHSPYERAVNAINNFGRAPIHLAIMRDNLQLVDYLIRCGANLNQLVKTRSKPSRMKPDASQTDMAGPSSTANKAYHYETALDIAKALGHKDCLGILEENRAQPASEVISSRQAMAGHSSRSLFDIQSVEGTSPIGFETSCSSASPNATVAPNLKVAASTLPKLPVAAASGDGGRVPKLRRPIPDSLPCTDSTGSSALSQNSLTSVRGGGGAGDSGETQTEQPLPAPPRADKFTRASCDNCAKGQTVNGHSAPRPYRGGISYNNDHICASIKCKLYDKNSQSNGCDVIGSRLRQAPAAHSAPLAAGPCLRGAGQEIVTNVNVYTSPCPHCMHQRQPDRRCLGCFSSNLARDEPQISKGEEEADELIPRYSQANQQATRGDAASCSADETTDGPSGSEGEDDDNDDDAGRLPSLVASGPSHTNLVRLRHLPPSQGHEQHLPVIMSDREQSTSATSNEQQEEDDKEGSRQEAAFEDTQEGQVMGDQGDIHNQMAPLARRPLVSPAFEEPRFDRYPAAAVTKTRVARADRYRNKQIKSPVAEYIHSPVMMHHKPEVVSRSRGATGRGAGRSSSCHQRTPDFSQVRARVESNRLPVSGYQDEPSRSKSMSVLSQRSTQPMRSDLVSPSVSRQTIIKTRRLSVDSVELATRVEKAIRKYRQETKLFEELQNLKRSQIRSGRANEALLVKRLVEHLRLDTRDLIGLDTYHGPYTYKSYERFLYDQLRKLSQSNCAKLSRHQPPYRTPQDDEPFNNNLAYVEPNYLDEDLKAEMELRRIIGYGHGDGDGAPKGNGQSDGDSDTESYVLEPSGALEDIRVKGDGSREEEGEELQSAKGSDFTAPKRESMQIIHSESVHDDSLPRENLVDTEPDHLDSEGLEKRSVSSQAELAADAAPADEVETEIFEEEAKSMSSAIIIDALGNIPRASSQIDLSKVILSQEEEAGQRQADADETAADTRESELQLERSSYLTAGQETGEPPMSDTISVMEPTPQATSGRRRSLVNIGNKMELIYHNVGIEINPAPEVEAMDDEWDQAGPKHADDDSDSVSRSSSNSRLADVVEEEEQTEDGRGRGAEKLETRPEGSTGETEEECPSTGGEEYSTPTTVVDSHRSSAGDSTETRQLASRTPRRASSPSACQAESKRGSRRDPTRWSGGSSFSEAPSSDLSAGKTQKVFNGHDLDALHRERSRSRGTQQARRNQDERQVEPDTRRKDSDSADVASSSENNLEKSDLVHEEQDMDLERRYSSDLSGNQAPKPAAKRQVTKRRFIRSQIPAAKYIPTVPLDEVRQRWSQIKSEERAKLRRVDNYVVEFIGNESTKMEADDGLIGLHATESQPANLKGQSYHQSLADTNEQSNRSNYTLLYEINGSMRGESRRGPDVEGSKAQTAGGGGAAKAEWCQRMAAQIVDVRTVKRTLSLPETVMYSNNLLKRFNILKL